MPPLYVKVAGAWKEVTPSVKVGGVWKDVDSGHVKVGGAWKEFYVSGIPLSIAADTANYNIFTAAGSPVGAVNINLTIETGVTVYSNDPSLKALIVGALPSGSVVNIENLGTIVGKGGDGGDGGEINYNTNGFTLLCAEYITTDVLASAGDAGGNAIENTNGTELKITNAAGFIFGGGGGGGASGGSHNGKNGFYGAWQVGHGGGGGAGYGASGAGAGGIQSGFSPEEGCNQGASFNKLMVGCVGDIGNVGGSTGGAAKANKINYSRGASATAYTADSGASGKGGEYGAAGDAGEAGEALPGTFANCFKNDSAGGAGGAAGKAINLNGGTVTWISGNTAARVKGAVS